MLGVISVWIEIKAMNRGGDVAIVVNRHKKKIEFRLPQNIEFKTRKKFQQKTQNGADNEVQDNPEYMTS